ncbi:MAG: T9SS C-terminal target domain-containing protein [Cytophagales bacterium]|nr:MAG: T9SS C-terminal target domain-containing protein [Cytophagales bacterium]
MVGGKTQSLYQIPIRATVYQGDDGSTSWTDAGIEELINHTNQIFRRNDVRIFLYLLCEIDRIDHGARSRPSMALSSDILDEFGGAGLWLDVIFVNDAPFAGLASLPFFDSRYAMMMSFNGAAPQLEATTFAHEVGHTLGLLHTHDTGITGGQDNSKVNVCRQEPVSRTADWVGLYSFGCPGLWWGTKPIGVPYPDGDGRLCSVNGDYLCDTHADPGMSNNVSEIDDTDLFEDCTYIYAGDDDDRIRDKLHNIRWDSPLGYNAPINIMSYSERACRSQLTPNQRSVMYWFAEEYYDFPMGYHANHPHFYENPIPDRFENDNFWQNARVYDLLVPQRQHRTFHPTMPNPSQPRYCDVDWVYFTITSPRRVIIRTSKVTGTDEPNTSLQVYAATADATSGRLAGIAIPSIALDDNLLSNFSLIDQVFLAGTYAVQVGNNQSLPNMNYFLTISLDREFDDLGIGIGSGSGGSIDLEDGGGALCVGEQLTATGVPEDCVARWSTNTAGLFISESGLVEPATNIHILTINGGQGFPAEVTLEIFCDGQTVPSSSYTFPVWIGSPVKPDIDLSGPCRNEDRLTATPEDEDEYEWHVTRPGAPGTSPVLISTTANYLLGTSLAVGLSHVKVRIRNRCGWSPYSDVNQINLRNCTPSDPRRIASLSPNPATNQVTVSVDERVVISSNGLDIRIKDLYAVEKIAVQSQSHRTNIDISSLPLGVYVVYIQSGQNTEYLRLVVE